MKDEELHLSNQSQKLHFPTSFPQENIFHPPKYLFHYLLPIDIRQTKFTEQ